MCRAGRFFLIFFAAFTVVFGIEVLAAEEKQYLVYRLGDAAVSLSAEDTGLVPLMPELGVYICKESKLAEVQKLSGVTWVEENAPAFLCEEPEVVPNDPELLNQWNLDMIGMKESWYWNADGKGTRVAVIDSGVDAAHPDLKGRVIAEKNFCDIGENGEIENPNDVMDTVGHGTAVASIIAAGTNDGRGMAGISSADLVSLRVYDTGSSVASIALAIRAAVDDYQCDVINLSLGTMSDRKILREAVEYALSKNVILVAAAGNHSGKDKDEGKDENAPWYPASYDGVISVGSVNRDGSYYSGSVANDGVKAAAPGVSVYAATLKNTWKRQTGTSFACPQVAGAAAVLRGIEDTLSPADYLALIRETATDTEEDGWDKKTGYGIINMKKMADEVFRRQGLLVFSRTKTEGGAAQCRVWNSADVKKEGIAAAAVYRGGDALQLISFQAEPFAAAPQEEVVLSCAAEAEETVRFMLWDGLGGISPLFTYPLCRDISSHF